MNKKSLRYTYHYSAMYQVNDFAGMNYIDGICNLTFKVDDMDGYNKLKEGICNRYKEKLIINSLSLLEAEEI